MPATLTGTPAAWTSGNITVPSDCNAIYMFWMYFSGSGQGGIGSATIGSASPNSTSVKAGLAGYMSTGVAVWYSPPTGSQAVSITWSPVVDAGIGPAVIFVFVKDSDTTGFRDADAQAVGNHSVTIDSNTTDLVIKSGGVYNSTMPAAGTGWTSQQTQTYNEIDIRVSTCDSPGASSTTANDEATGVYAGVVAVSVKAGAATATSFAIPPRTSMQSILAR